MGSGEHGIVVFSLGSLVSSMPKEKAAIFFKAFSMIPQRVRKNLSISETTYWGKSLSCKAIVVSYCNLSVQTKCKIILSTIPKFTNARLLELVRDLSLFSSASQMFSHLSAKDWRIYESTYPTVFPAC